MIIDTLPDLIEEKKLNIHYAQDYWPIKKEDNKEASNKKLLILCDQELQRLDSEISYLEGKIRLLSRSLIYIREELTKGKE